MERGFGYFEAVNANQEQLSKISDDKLIMLALCEILSPIEKIINLPYATAIVNELEKRANE
jgi:hypothetical protein